MVALLFDIARIEKAQYTAVGESTAGVYSIPILRYIRTENSSGKCPVQQVGALPVSPAFSSLAVGALRRILKINVIVSAEEAKSVRVIQPAADRFKMKFLTPVVFHLPHPFLVSMSLPRKSILPSAACFISEKSSGLVMITGVTVL